jgi:hypothetical protein
MPNQAVSRPAVAARLAAFRRDEAGAMRTDMIVGGLGIVAVLAILIMSDMESADPVISEAGTETAAAAPTRTISSVGFRAPEPAPLPGGSDRRSYASPGFEDRFTSNPDNEVARLEAETAAARAALDAAGGAPPMAQPETEAEAQPVAGETAATDETVAADDAAEETPAGDGG